MNLLKKSAIILLAMLSIASFASCDSSESDSKDNNNNSNNNSSSNSVSDSESNSEAEEKEEEEEAEINPAVFDFKFYVNGEEYTIPAPFEDFAAKGWEYSYEQDETVPAHKYLIGSSIEKDGMDPSVYFMNDTDKDITVTEAAISNIAFDKFDMEENEIKYGDNIIMGKTTIDEVKAAFGEPSSEISNEDLGYTALDYQKDVYIEVGFTFDESGILDRLEITNQPDLY